MTLTRHGHHIRGTVDTDEPTHGVNKARCGGPGLCTNCSREAAFALNKLANESKEEPAVSADMTMSGSAQGNGPLTVKHMRDILAGLPDEAVLTGHAGSSQMDGDTWYFQARWGQNSWQRGENGTKAINYDKPPRIGDSVSRSSGSLGFTGAYGDGVAFPGDH
jgi:hypothetical protein